MTNFPNYIYWQLSDNLQPDFASLSLCCSATLIFFELAETHQVQTFEPTCKFKGFNEVQLPHNQGIAIYRMTYWTYWRTLLVLYHKTQSYTACPKVPKKLCNLFDIRDINFLFVSGMYSLFIFGFYAKLRITFIDVVFLSVINFDLRRFLCQNFEMQRSVKNIVPSKQIFY